MKIPCNIPVSSFSPENSSTETTPALTRREIEVLLATFDGNSAQKTADMLFCSRRTVEYHLANVYRKLGVTNRVAAMKTCLVLGLLTQEEFLRR